jgi:hypothetical protein
VKAMASSVARYSSTARAGPYFMINEYGDGFSPASV